MGRKHIVMLVICRRVIADFLIESVGRRPRMEAFGVYHFKEAGSSARLHHPEIALVEIPERYGFPAMDALDVCKEIKEASPGCKILLLCPEQDPESVDACIEAKRCGEIEDFMFYEASAEFLTSKLESLCPT